MIGLPSTVKIFLITEPTDMRKGFYTLADIVKRLGHNPLSGHLFVFLSSSGDRCTILFWSDGGFILWYKKLEQGKFKKPKIDTQEAEIFISPLMCSFCDGKSTASVHINTYLLRNTDYQCCTTPVWHVCFLLLFSYLLVRVIHTSGTTYYLS